MRLRLYVMFVAPPEKEVEWSDAGLEGSWRFLARIWRFVDQWCEQVKTAAPVADVDAGKLRHCGTAAAAQNARDHSPRH